jgi:hypothetical protein
LPRDIVCLRNISINTLHKGDDDDDDDSYNDDDDNNNNNNNDNNQVQRMWNVKTNVIPVIIGANGTISKSFRKYLSNVPVKHEIKELHKTAILGTAHIL